MPTDELNAWANLTYRMEDDIADLIALNVGARMQVCDKMGISPRIEWLNVDPDGSGGSADFIAVTATADYMLLDNLVAKLEVKWDHSLDTDDFYDGDEDHQVLSGTQLIMTF